MSTRRDEDRKLELVGDRRYRCVVCPLCEDSYIQLSEPRVAAGGAYVTIPAKCEREHEFQIEFEAVAGHTVLFCRVPLTTPAAAT